MMFGKPKLEVTNRHTKLYIVFERTGKDEFSVTYNGQVIDHVRDPVTLFKGETITVEIPVGFE